MEQDRFDALAKKVFDGSSRRRVIGGALASVVGAGVAAVAGTSAKNKNGKAKAQGKKGKGRAKGEFVCTAINNPCPGGSCCQSTGGGITDPVCVSQQDQINSNGKICGDAGFGSGVCQTCPTGTSCDIITGRCVCTATSCPNGCCVNNDGFGGADQCIANGNGAPVSSQNPNVDGAYVCGTGGVSCESFSSFCGDTIFNGCCSAQGFCVAGTANANCGSSGQLCETCQNDSSCGIDQACTGGTTTTTTTVAPTTTPAACAAPKVLCGTGATAKCCNKCNGKGTGCKKKHHHKH